MKSVSVENSHKFFNLRVNLGVSMQNELSENEANYLIPKIQPLDDYFWVYIHAYNYVSKNGYSEFRMDDDVLPEALPANWFKIVRQQLTVQNVTQYNDPTIVKKTNKRFAAEG